MLAFKHIKLIAFLETPKIFRQALIYLPNEGVFSLFYKFSRLLRIEDHNETSYTLKSSLGDYLDFGSIRSALANRVEGCRLRFKLIGSGYFFQELSTHQVAIHAGMSHVIILTLNPPLVWNILGRKKKILACSSNSSWHNYQLMTYLRQVRIPDDYKGKGLRLLKESKNLKKGKKKFI